MRARLSLRGVTLTVVLFAGFGARAAPPSPPDVPGAGSSLPKVLIIFDNSRSMQALPEDETRLDCAPDDDFHPSVTFPDGSTGPSRTEFPMASFANNGAAGACELKSGGVYTPDPTRCRSKFCIGKSVMYGALDSVASVVELGFASYYQYLRKTETTTGGNLSTTCEYDVIAGPGELAKQNHVQDGLTVSGTPYQFSALTDWRGSTACTPTKWNHACVDRTAGNAALAETAKECFFTGTYDWTSQRYADNTYGSPAAAPTSGATNPYLRITCSGANNWNACTTSTLAGGGNVGPLSAETRMLSYNGTAPQLARPYAGTGMYTYYYYLSAPYPSQATGGVGGDCTGAGCAQYTFETGPFPAACSTQYPTAASRKLSFTGGGSPFNAGSAAPGQMPSAPMANLANRCSGAEPCDFTQRWQRYSIDGSVSAMGPTSGGNGYWFNKPAGPVGTAGTVSTKAGTTCVQTCVGCSGTQFSGDRQTTSAGALSCSSNASYTGGALPERAAGIPGCGPGDSQCNIGAAVVSSNLTREAYDDNPGAYVASLAGGGSAAYNVAGPTAVDVFVDLSPGNNTCPGGNSPGSTYSFTNAAPAGASSALKLVASGALFGKCAAAGNVVSPLCKATLSSKVFQSDTGLNRCTYSVNRHDLSLTVYQCRYDRREWRYACGSQYYCGWQKDVQTWKPRYYQTRWNTTGGELVGRLQVSASSSANLCGTAFGGAGPSLSGGACPMFNTTDARCAGGRSCVLKWSGPVSGTESVGGVTLWRGRLHNFNGANFSAGAAAGGGFNNTDANKFCMAPDHQLGAGCGPSPLSCSPRFSAFAGGPRDPALDLVAAQTTAGGGNSWCWGGLTPPTNNTYVHVLSDPYSPTLNKSNTGGSMYPTPGVMNPFAGLTVAGERVTQVEYSLPGLPWSSQPPLKQKELGLSHLPASWSTAQLYPGYPADTAALSWVPMGPGAANLPLIKKIMSAYDAATNPTGLRMPDQWSNQNTPLYGSLLNASDYLKTVMAAAPTGTDSSGNGITCGDYAVILVTDGFEDQSMSTNGMAQHPNLAFDDFRSPAQLRSAVAAVRDTAGPAGPPLDKVKTYIVGFGEGLSGAGGASTALDEMAQEAGTADMGRAYFATSPAAFQNKIDQIFASILNGKYTRSKPLVATTGTATYFGYFEFASGKPEWKGHLDRYETALLGATGAPSPTWQFDVEVNAQTAGSRRVYTPLNNGNLVDVSTWATVSTWAPITPTANKVQFAIDSAAAPDVDTVQNFLLNPTSDAPYAGGLKRSSRVGDVYHSTPAVIGGQPPFPSAWAGDDTAEQAGYDLFRAANASRDVRVVVGANDGMLHAICEANPSGPTDCGGPGIAIGGESWAFIPPLALPRLSNMRNQHTFTVDGSFGVSDVCTAAACTTAAGWKTVLLGSLRQGGNAIFALDVTDVSTPKFLWQFSAAWLGETWSPPTVARVKWSGGERWVAFLGGGYNLSPNVANTGAVLDMTTHLPPTDRATTAVWSWDLGTGAKNNVPGRVSLVRSGAASPYVQQAFFGDTQGRLGRMNVGSSPVQSDWLPAAFFDPASVACADSVLTGTNAQIFDADDDPATAAAVGALPLPPGQRQPFYQRPIVVKDPYQRNIVYAGTGDAVNPAGSGTYDYFFALLDENGADRNDVCGPAQGGKPLWVKRFKPGQKVLSDGVVAGTVVFVPTFVPGTGCSAKGDAVIYAFDRTTGAPKPAFEPPAGSPPGSPGSPSVKITGGGIPSDLTFVPDPGDPTGATGKLVFADQGSGSGNLHGQEVNVGRYGSVIRGFKRVK